MGQFVGHEGGNREGVGAVPRPLGQLGGFLGRFLGVLWYSGGAWGSLEDPGVI